MNRPAACGRRPPLRGMGTRKENPLSGGAPRNKTNKSMIIASFPNFPHIGHPRPHKHIVCGEVAGVSCCRVTDICEKEVIFIKDGSRVGCVCDVEVDTGTGCLVSIIVYGRQRFWGLFGREEDICIPWRDIEVIGEDTVLVGCEPPHSRAKRRSLWPLLGGRR